MKRHTFPLFCLKVILFFGLLWIIDCIIGVAFVSMKDTGLKVNPENMWLKTPFVVEKVNTDVVIIGSSKASHHYVPSILSDSLGMSVYNGGQDGCFFLYQNCLINMLLDRHHPKMIIWDIQPSSFFYGENAAIEYQNFRYLSPYYHKSKWATEYINSESGKMKFRMLSEMFAYNSKSLNYLFPLISHASPTHEGYIPLENERYTYPNLGEVTQDPEEYTPMVDRLALLAQTIRRCKKEQVRLYLFISPEYSLKSHSYLSAVQDLQEVAMRNGIDCHDYSSEEVFMNDSTLFKDASHLNDKGAHLFTNKIIKDL